jgi:hypothetical protein
MWVPSALATSICKGNGEVCARWLRNTLLESICESKY